MRRQLIDFAKQAETLGVGEIRLAPKRMLIVLCPSQASAAALRESAEALGFVTQASDPRTGIAACPGKPACASGHIAARDIAAEIATRHGDILDRSVTLHISGCSKGCAHPAKAALTLVGSENGAGLVVGGTAKSAPDAYTSGQDFMRVFNGISDLVRQEIRPGEDAKTCLSRLGKDRIAEAFEKG